MTVDGVPLTSCPDDGVLLSAAVTVLPPVCAVNLVSPLCCSIPTYDTMNRFPRASAPPRHIDW